MKTTIAGIFLCLIGAGFAPAHPQGFQDPLLDHFVGEWVLQGMIAGGEKTHDIVAEWVLGHLHDVRIPER